MSGLKPKDLDKSAAKEWTPRQVVHHLTDAEAQSYARVRRLVAEPLGSIIQGYAEGLWSENEILGYEQLPIENSMAVFVAVRAASLDIVCRLSLDDIERYAKVVKVEGTPVLIGSRLIPTIHEITLDNLRK